MTPRVMRPVAEFQETPSVASSSNNWQKTPGCPESSPSLKRPWQLPKAISPTCYVRPLKRPRMLLAVVDKWKLPPSQSRPTPARSASCRTPSYKQRSALVGCRGSSRLPGPAAPSALESSSMNLSLLASSIQRAEETPLLLKTDQLIRLVGDACLVESLGVDRIRCVESTASYPCHFLVCFAVCAHEHCMAFWKYSYGTRYITMGFAMTL